MLKTIDGKVCVTPAQTSRQRHCAIGHSEDMNRDADVLRVHRVYCSTDKPSAATDQVLYAGFQLPSDVRIGRARGCDEFRAEGRSFGSTYARLPGSIRSQTHPMHLQFDKQSQLGHAQHKLAGCT